MILSLMDIKGFFFCCNVLKASIWGSKIAADYSNRSSPISLMTFSTLVSISWKEESSKYLAIWTLRSASLDTVGSAAACSTEGQQFISNDVKLGGKLERTPSTWWLCMVPCIFFFLGSVLIQTWWHLMGVSISGSRWTPILARFIWWSEWRNAFWLRWYSRPKVTVG